MHAPAVVAKQRRDNVTLLINSAEHVGLGSAGIAKGLRVRRQTFGKK
jgi:hypothetical protein